MVVEKMPDETTSDFEAGLLAGGLQHPHLNLNDINL
jgi:hypothetical protein